MTYNILLKRIFIIFKSNWIYSFLRGEFISFASHEIVHNTKKIVQIVDTIIDVGANNGQFQSAARYYFPNAEIHSFEPIPELYEKLLKKNHCLTYNYNLALGNEKGELTFNKNKYNHSSSFYEISKDNHNFPSSEVTRITVSIERLDNLFENINLKNITLLKLDVQGFEMEVLKGGEETIRSHVSYIIVEANFVELYKNQPTFTELNKYLNSLGFEIKSMLDFNLGKDKSYIEADFLYHKTK